MKNTIYQTMLFTLVLCLCSCASNTPRQNQAVGAVVGAGAGAALAASSGPSPGTFTVLGTGTIVGALIGSTWNSNPMDKSDKEKAYQAIAAGKSATWQNPTSKTTYTVIPARNYVRFDGNSNCRQFTATQTIVDEKARTIQRIACQGSKGDWELVH